jgi:hypothetical protein
MSLEGTANLQQLNLRAQAGLCLEIAGHMNDRKTAENLKAEAARHHAEANAFEEVDHHRRQKSLDQKVETGALTLGPCFRRTVRQFRPTFPARESDMESQSRRPSTGFENFGAIGNRRNHPVRRT